MKIDLKLQLTFITVCWMLEIRLRNIEKTTKYLKTRSFIRNASFGFPGVMPASAWREMSKLVIKKHEKFLRKS